MWLKVSNLHCKVIRASATERGWLSSYLCYEDAQARFRRFGPSEYNLFSALTESFPTGLLPIVRKGASDAGHQIELEDERTIPCGDDVNTDIAWLRDYQLEATKAAINAGRGLLWCPTGSGKTEIWIALTKRLPCQWIFFVHKKELLHQSAERYYKRTGVKAGLVGDGIWEEGEGNVTVVTFQTVAAALQRKDPKVIKLLAGAGAIGVDEAHITPAASFWKIAMATPNAFYRYGFSGTPLARGDKRSVYAMAALGPVLYRIHPNVLIEAGVLARPKIRMITLNQETDSPTWQGVYGSCIVRSTKRNGLIAKLAQGAAKPCLVFVKEISHGQDLEKRLAKAGVKVDFVWGNSETSSRKLAIQRLVRGDLDVLVCSVIFQEGVDIPALDSVVIGSGGRSVIATLQRIGRGMRTDGGRKKEFEVWDIMDTGNKWLTSQARARMRAYSAEGYETIVEGPRVI